MYTIISIATLIISIYFFKKVSGSLSLTKLNMISWIFYVPLILQSFVASVIIINGWDDHYILNSVGPDVRMYGWIATQYTLLALPLGMLLSLWLVGLKTNKKTFSNFTNKPIVSSLSKRDTFVKLPLHIVSVLSVGAVAYTFYTIGYIPFFQVFSGSDDLALSLMRQEVHREFPGNVYVRNVLALTLSPLLSYVAYSYWRKTSSKIDFYWFAVLFVSSVFIVTYNLAKAPLIYYFLGFVFLKVLIDGRIKLKYLLFSFASFFVLIVILYLTVTSVTDASILFSINSGIGGRVFLSQAAGLYLSFAYFPSYNDFIGLGSLSSLLSSAFGIDYIDRSARIVMALFRPSAVEEGVAGVMNSLFIGEAWANFGLFGVIFAPIYVGFFIQTLFLFFLKSRKTPILLGSFAYFSYRMPITGGVNDFFYNPGMIIILFIFLNIYFLSLLLKKQKTSV